MTDRDTTAWSVRAIAILATLAIGFAVAQPWGYFDPIEETDPALTADVVFGVETITGAVTLGLALLGVVVVLSSWRLESAVALSGLGALIGLFGTTLWMTAPSPERTGLYFLLGGAVLLFGGGVIGVRERLGQRDPKTLSSAFVAVAGGVLIAVSPFLAHADCLGKNRPCFEDLWLNGDYSFVAPSAALVLVLLSTLIWYHKTQLLTIAVGAISSLVGIAGSILLFLHSNASAPLKLPTLTDRLYTYVGLAGGIMILLGGIVGLARSHAEQRNGEQPPTESRS